MPHMNELIDLLKRCDNALEYFKQYTIVVNEPFEEYTELRNDIQMILDEHELLKVGHLART
jgi:hypothetical protein